MSRLPERPDQSEFLLYESGNGTQIQVRLEGETVWLTQAQMAELFETTVANVNIHIRNTYTEGELEPAPTIKDHLIVRIEGERSIQRNIAHYNLDVIISVGYRVKSLRGTQFRIWATQRLREYIVKGFALDDERLKENRQIRRKDVKVAKNYLDEEEIRRLNRLVTQYLDFAESMAERRQTMTMANWKSKLDAFLQVNEHQILCHAGRVSNEEPVNKAPGEFEKFEDRRRALGATQPTSDFDEFVEKTRGIDKGARR